MAYKTFRQIDRPTLYILHVRAVRRKLCAALAGPKALNGRQKSRSLPTAPPSLPLLLSIVPDVSGIRIENRYGRTQGTSVPPCAAPVRWSVRICSYILIVHLVQLVLNMPHCLCTLELLTAQLLPR